MFSVQKIGVTKIESDKKPSLEGGQSSSRAVVP
jgi:hypothetical protein